MWESLSEREPGSAGACKKGRVEETEQESGRRGKSGDEGQRVMCLRKSGEERERQREGERESEGAR